MKAENLDYSNFWDELEAFIQRKNLRSMFKEPEGVMDRSEYAYDRARELLDSKTEDDLVLHVAACEEFCKVFAYLAYEMGREHGPREEPLDDWDGSPEFWAEMKRKWDEEGGLDRNDLERIVYALNAGTAQL